MSEDGWCEYCKKGAVESGMTRCKDCLKIEEQALREQAKMIFEDVVELFENYRGDYFKVNYNKYLELEKKWRREG